MFDALLSFFANILYSSAISAGGAASNWNTYQPEEPAKLKELIK